MTDDLSLYVDRHPSDLMAARHEFGARRQFSRVLLFLPRIVCGLLLVGITPKTSTAWADADIPREPSGADYRQAVEARDHADELRAEFETRYHWTANDGSNGKYPSSEAARADRERVIATYLRAQERFPNTEIASYLGLRLSGFYQYCHDNDLAQRSAELVAKQTLGASQQEACFIAGMIALDSRHQPAVAAQWLKQIVCPAITRPAQIHGKQMPSTATRQEQLYIQAQQQLARIEMMVGDGTMARARIARLGERYPQDANRFQRRLLTDQKTYIEGQFPLDIGTLFDEHLLHELPDTKLTQVPPAVSPSIVVPASPYADTSRIEFWLGLSACGTGLVLVIISQLMRKEK